MLFLLKYEEDKHIFITLSAYAASDFKVEENTSDIMT